MRKNRNVDHGFSPLSATPHAHAQLLLRYTRNTYRRCSMKCNITFAPNNVADEKCTSTSLSFRPRIYVHAQRILLTSVIQDRSCSLFLQIYTRVSKFCDLVHVNPRGICIYSDGYIYIYIISIELINDFDEMCTWNGNFS